MPQFPGVPIVPDDAQPEDPGQLLEGDDLPTSTENQNSAQWGLFDPGTAQPVITADNVVAVSHRAQSQISDYPVEDGGFGSYDKVQLPFTGRIRFSTGGNVSDKSDLINSCEQAKQSLDLYAMVMPEATYINVNVTDYDYERTNGNPGLLVVDVMVEEVRPTGTASYTTSSGDPPITNPKQPGAADQLSDGTVQPTDVSPSEEQLLTNTFLQSQPLGQPALPGH